MNTIDLGTGYIVSAFPDFESAFGATEAFCENGFKVAYLNEVAYMQEPEVEQYVLKYEAQPDSCYHNYRFPHHGGETVALATESLKTALALLEQKNNQEAKFVLIVAPAKVKVRKHQKV